MQRDFITAVPGADNCPSGVGEEEGQGDAQSEGVPPRRSGAPHVDTQRRRSPEPVTLTNHNENITDVNRLDEVLNSSEAPEHLVAFESSGLLRGALTKAGKLAISVDYDPSSTPGLHYQGDAKDVIDRRRWKAVYFTNPDRHQHLRIDNDTLAYKIADGRLFWAGAKFLWCLCRNNADMIFIEQADDIGHDYYGLSRLPEVDVTEHYINQVGGVQGRLVRFTSRNMMTPPEWWASREERAKNTSWHVFDAIAAASPLHLGPPARLNHREVIETYAANWHKAGHPVPPGYHSKDGEPPSESLRRYQYIKGEGRPRAWAPVTPRSFQGGAAIRHSDLVLSGRSHGGDAETTTHAPLTQRVAYKRTSTCPPLRNDVTNGTTIQLGSNLEGATEALTTGTTRTRSPESIRLIAAPPHQLAHVVVPTRVVEDEVQVYLPPGDDDVWGIATDALQHRATPLMPAIGRATAKECKTLEEPVVLRAGTSTEGAKLFAAIVAAGPDTKAARHTKSSWVRRATRVAMWCTLSVLTSGTPQAYWAQVAACTVKQFTTRDSHTTQLTALEDVAREATGLRPGVGVRGGPLRDHLRGEGVTPRQLLSTANRGIDLLRHEMITRSTELGGLYAEWSEAIVPMQIDEVPKDLWNTSSHTEWGT